MADTPERVSKQERAQRPTPNKGRWSSDEHARFLVAYAKWGRNWTRISEDVGTRISKQVKSHDQKCRNPSKPARLGSASPRRHRICIHSIRKTRCRTCGGGSICLVSSYGAGCSSVGSGLEPATDAPAVAVAHAAAEPATDTAAAVVASGVHALGYNSCPPPPPSLSLASTAWPTSLSVQEVRHRKA